MGSHVIEDLKLALPLVVAALLGAGVGWDREAKHKAAGLRTLMLVSISAALFVTLGEIASKFAESNFREHRTDPVRIIQAVAIGIGFIGSGTVRMEEERGGGLTTAVSVWATAAVGTAAGFRHYTLALVATVLTVVVLRVLRPLETAEHART